MLDAWDGGRAGGERTCAGCAKKLFASLLLMAFGGPALGALFGPACNVGVPLSSGLPILVAGRCATGGC